MNIANFRQGGSLLISEAPLKGLGYDDTHPNSSNLDSNDATPTISSHLESSSEFANSESSEITEAEIIFSPENNESQNDTKE